MANKKFGRQVPTVSFYCEYDETLFEQATDLYRKSKHEAYEWQIELLKPLMAIDDEGYWTHQKFGYAIPRRNGKTEVVYLKEIWSLFQGLRILHTAHRISTSHSSFEKVKSYIEAMGLVDGEDFNSIRAKGQERIELYETGGVIQFRTRTSTGGLGEGFDLLVIDEAQEYTEDQESALKYTVTDSANPQTIMCGTPPTPLSSGTVFTDYRQTTLDGGNKYSGWAEWSVPEIHDIHDVDAWYMTNPSMGYHLNERKIEAELGADELDHNIQRLGYWVSYNVKSAITEEEWQSMLVDELPELTSNLFVGIKYGNDGVNVAMSIAVKTDDGDVFVEAIDCQSTRNGNGWILNFINRANVEAVVVDGAGGQAILEAEMKSARIKPKPLLPKVKEVIVANASFERAVNSQAIRHKGQPSLVQIVSNSEKRPIGSNGGFGYKSQFEDYDIALMDSMILAYWSCIESKTKVKQKVRY